jgi:hypothetical protein
MFLDLGQVVATYLKVYVKADFFGLPIAVVV